MLLDKGFYDYDFEKTEKPVAARPPKSDEEIKNILAGFGVATEADAPKSDEELQDYIIKQMEDK